MEGFQHRVASQITVMRSQRVGEGEYEWSSAEGALEAEGMWPVKEYIWRHQDTIAYYIYNHPIYEM